MPPVRDLLLRFRPSGAPGAAGPAGVPVDVSAQWSAELAPVFAALAATEDECTAVASEGLRRADQARATMRTRADALRAGLHQQAEAERAMAAAAAHDRALGPGGALDSALGGEIEDQVVALRARAESLMPRYLVQVSTAVEALCTGATDGPR